MEDISKINATGDNDGANRHGNIPRHRTVRKLPPIAEIIAIAADVCDVGAEQIIKPGFATAPVSAARSCVILIAFEIGYGYPMIAKAFQVKHIRNISRCADIWAYKCKPPQQKTRMLKLNEVRDRVLFRMDQLQDMSAKQKVELDDVNAVRNKKIKLLYNKGKGWSVKGLARMFDIEPVVVCDVLGLDRSFAKW